MGNTLSAALVTLAILLTVGTAEAAERSVTLAVGSWACNSRPYVVKLTLDRVPGVSDVEVSFLSDSAVVTFDDSKTTVDMLMAALTDVGITSRKIR